MTTASTPLGHLQQPPLVDFDSVRGNLPPIVYCRSFAFAYGLTFATLALYAGLAYLSYTANSFAWLLIWSIARGLSIGPVFIVAHDACHDSLSPSSRLNYWLGQLCFLPSWHTFTGWKMRHNHVHHRHTNILELDTGYPPASRDQYAVWPWWRRLRYRLARTPAGAGLLYLPEALEAQVFPSRTLRRQFRKVDARHPTEWTLVWLWIAAEVALFSGLLAQLGVVEASPNQGWSLFAIGFVLTHWVWNWQMGITTFLHHFHPEVEWHTSEKAPAAAQRQLQSTVHVDLRRMHPAMLNIFVHTAHHVDTRIPLYRLPLAQAALEKQFASDISRWTFSLQAALHCFRECQLWNPTSRRWERFQPPMNQKRTSTEKL